MIVMSIHLFENQLIGASLSELHIDKFAVKFLYIYICRTSCRKSLPALILHQSTFRSNSLTWYIVMDSPSTSSSSWNRRGCAIGRNEKGPAVLPKQRDKRNELRLKQRRERDRAKRAAQSVEQWQARLHKSATERKRQAAETPDHREARLEDGEQLSRS